jgi:hypothetical protein
VKVGGLTGSSVRMVSAIAGIVSLIYLYKLLRLYIKVPLVVALVFAWLSMEPWRLHFSRNAFETHLSAMFFCMGAYYLIKLGKNWWTLLLLALSAYSYHSARLSGPMLILLWGMDPIMWLNISSIKVWYQNQQQRISLWLPMLIVSILIIFPVFMANSSLVLTRFNQENVFKRFYPYTPKELIVGNPFTSLKANSVYYFGAIISGHIFSYISPINLNQRIYNWVRMSPQFIPGMGMLGWIEGMVFLVGLVIIIKNIFKNEKYRFLVYWMVAGIAPAAATWTWYHPLRSLNIFPAVEIIVAIGIVFLFSKLIVGRLWLGISFGIFLVTMVFTVNNELLYSAYENNGEYQPGGFKEGMSYLKEIQGNYEKVIIDSPHAQSFIFVLFYQPVEPELVHKYANIRPKPGVEGNLNFNFDKFEFRQVDWPKDRELKNTVFWTDNQLTAEEVSSVPGAKLRKVVSNSVYDTAYIVTIE